MRLEVSEVEAAIGIPFPQWSHACHAISIAIVKSGLFENARVARGWADGVTSQHSWVTLGGCYDRSAQIIDPTLWSYRTDVEGIWHGTLKDDMHSPHGAGSIWDSGCPVHMGGPTIKLTREGLSESANAFLKMVGPLDWSGWNTLLNGPQQGWPSAEIVKAAANQGSLAAVIKIDIVGMSTDLNPGGLYLADSR